MKLYLITSCLIMTGGVFFFPTFLDQGIFLTNGWLITEGYVPYVDFLDNKPPGIYWWNALKTLLFSSRFGWVMMDFGINCLILFTAFSLFKRNQKNHGLTTTAAFAAFTFFPSVFEYGGYTEIYGSGMILASLLTFHKKKFILAGILACLSVWFKEPFLLFLLYPVFQNQPYRTKQYITGVLAAAFVGIFTLWFSGSAHAYLEILISNFVYARHPFLWDNLIPSNIEETVKLSFRFLPLVLTVILYYKKQISSISLYFIVAGLAAVLIGKRFYGHYFLFFVPAWLSLLKDLLHSNFSEIQYNRFLNSMISIAMIVQCYVIYQQMPRLREQQALTDTIQASVAPDYTLLIDISNGFIFAHSRILPAPMKGFSTFKDRAIHSHAGIDSANLQILQENFYNDRPDYLYKPESIFWFNEEWLLDYEMTNVKGLYRRKEIPAN